MSSEPELQISSSDQKKAESLGLLLLAQMMRSTSITEQVIGTLEPEHLSKASGRSAFGILFFAIKTHYNKHKSIPDEAALTIELNTFCDKYQAARPEVVEDVQDLLPTFFAFRPRVTAQSEPMAMAFAEELVTRYVHQPAATELLSTALASSEIGQELVSGLAKKLTDLEGQMLSSGGGVSVNATMSMTLDESGERVHTGVPWVDARLGGGNGPILGSVLGIIAPQGHGKTSLGIQLGVAQALQQRHVLLILAEEGISKAIRRRIMACATDIPTTELEKAKDKPLDAVGDRNPIAVAEKLAAVDKYLHIVDMVNKPRDIESALSEINKLQRRGQPPTYVYVDWAGPIAQSMLIRGYKGMEFKNKYDALKALATELALIAQRTNTIIAVSHQMAASHVKKGWFAENDQYCAMECNTFTEMFKYVMVVNPIHKATGLMWMTIAKSRDDPAVKRFIVKLRGEVSKFYDVTTDYEPNVTKGRGFKLKNKVQNKVPTE